VQLFLRGYGTLRDIRKPLANQYVRFGKSVIAQIRSGYADNWRVVPEGHKGSLIKAMEPLNDELDAGGYRLPDDVYIQGLRQTKQVSIDLDAFDADAFLDDLTDSQPLFQSMAPLVLPLLNGLLIFDDGQSDDSGEIDDVE